MKTRLAAAKPPAPAVTIRNLQRKIPVKIAVLQTFASRALPHCLGLGPIGPEMIASLPQICVFLISDARMTGLHREFLKKTGSTDVITFQHGEIFISVEMARRNARRFGNSLLRELELYIAHGFLHLAGLDDRKPADARKMRAAQGRILRLFGNLN